VIGLFLAILLDQKIRGEGILRPIYLYPMALSFIVTGTAWKWFLDPGIGLENTMHLWGWESFSFNWIKSNTMAIYCLVIAAVWQSSGFVMAMFLAGLRGVDNEIIKAAQIDGASTATIYRRIIIPLMRPVFLSAFVVLAHLAIKAYDLVIALTGVDPGRPPNCQLLSCIPTPSRGTRWVSARRPLLSCWL
jgi:glucose/mannose transport system permease protein